MENQKRDMKNTNGGTPYEFYLNSVCFSWNQTEITKKYHSYSVCYNW